MSSPQQQRQHFFMFIITTITKLCFAGLFLAAAIFHHSEQSDVILKFCERVDDRDVIWCYFDFIGGLLICGTILLFISILTEAFGVDKNGYITILHLIGCLCLMAASVIYVLLGLNDDLFDFFVIDEPDVIGNLWIAGGLITAFCQAYLISRSKGIFTVLTFLLACIGSVLFMIFGIISNDDIQSSSSESLISRYDACVLVLITGSAFHTLHAILYPFANYKKVMDEVRTPRYSHSTNLRANPNVYNRESLEKETDLEAAVET